MKKYWEVFLTKYEKFSSLTPTYATGHQVQGWVFIVGVQYSSGPALFKFSDTGWQSGGGDWLFIDVQTTLIVNNINDNTFSLCSVSTGSNNALFKGNLPLKASK